MAVTESLSRIEIHLKRYFVSGTCIFSFCNGITFTRLLMPYPYRISYSFFAHVSVFIFCVAIQITMEKWKNQYKALWNDMKSRWHNDWIKSQLFAFLIWKPLNGYIVLDSIPFLFYFNTKKLLKVYSSSEHNVTSILFREYL